MKRFTLLGCIVLTIGTIASLSPAHAAGTIDLGTLVVTPLGQFNNVDYTQYEAMFDGVTSHGNPYRVPCRIIAPDIGQDRSGVFVFDWLNNAAIKLGLQIPLARTVFLRDDLLFNNGHVYATVRSSYEALGAPWLFDRFDENGLPVFSGFETTGELIAAPADEFDIVADFVRALSLDPAASTFAGEINRKVGLGYSNSGWKLRGFVRHPLGAGVFDLTLSGGIGAYTAITTGPELESRLDPNPPPAAGGLEMSFNTETEADGNRMYSALHNTRHDAPNARSYEVAGASHSPATAEFLTFYATAGTPDVDSINRLEWTPFTRALFVAGLDWCNGLEPPPSIWLGGPNDPTIARDAKGNARIRYVGGDPVSTSFYRHPEVAVGLGRYIGVYFSPDLFRSLAGEFIDLSHTFDSHDVYVDAITQHSLMLVGQRYLLPEDAAEIILRAENSDVGNP